MKSMRTDFEGLVRCVGSGAAVEIAGNSIKQSGVRMDGIPFDVEDVHGGRVRVFPEVFDNEAKRYRMFTIEQD